MKTRTFRGLVVMVLTMASIAAMASMASAQVVIADSANGTGNTINAGGGFGPTEIRNSANGDHNTINAGPTYGQTVMPQSYYRTYTVRRDVYPSYTVPHSYPSVTRYHHVQPQVHYAYATPPAPYVEQVQYTGPQTSFPVRPWSGGGTEIRNSANGTGNTPGRSRTVVRRRRG